MRKPALWLFDSVTLSNFALVGRMDILSNRYRARGFVTTQVVDELTRGVAAGHAPLTDCLDLLDQGIFQTVTLDKIERATFRQLIGQLGAGEAGTIAAAFHRHGIAVTDDLAARRTCADVGVPVTGTIGILRSVLRDRVLTLTAANDLLHRMSAAGFHSPIDRLTMR